MKRASGTRKGILDCRGGMRGYVKCLWYCQRVMEGYLPNAVVIEACWVSEGSYGPPSTTASVVSEATGSTCTKSKVVILQHWAGSINLSHIIPPRDPYFPSIIAAITILTVSKKVPAAFSLNNP